MTIMEKIYVLDARGIEYATDYKTTLTVSSYYFDVTADCSYYTDINLHAMDDKQFMTYVGR